MIIGGALGGLIGADIDQRRCELSKIAKNHGLDMLVEKIENLPQPGDSSVSVTAASQNQTGTQTADGNAVGLRIAIIDQGRQFKSGSAIPTPQAAGYFREIADNYLLKQPPSADEQTRRNIESRNRNMRILLVGHTDDMGSSQANADLSEQRAQAVAKIFQGSGIAAQQIFFQGAGETLPIADNRDEAGRERNRRVEIADLSNDAAFRAYLANRKPNVAYYRPATTPMAAAPSGVDNKETVPPVARVPPKPKPLLNQASEPVVSSAPDKSPSATSSSRPSITAAHSRTPTKLAVSGNTNNAPHQTTGPVLASAPRIDFGGQPVDKNLGAVDIGKLTASKPFNFISTAHADDSPVGNCTQDRPRVGHDVKSLSNGKVYATSEYLPGVYDSTWVGQVNGHLVALTHVAVLRDGGSPARKPNLLIYRDYKGDKNDKPEHSGNPEVTAYRGDKALLYRVFNSGPVRCMDIVIPSGSPGEAPGSALYYERGRQIYGAAYAPKLAK